MLVLKEPTNACKHTLIWTNLSDMNLDSVASGQLRR